MKIYGNIYDPLRPDRAQGGGGITPRNGDGPAQPVQPVPPVTPKGDSVEISDHGRSLASTLEAELDPERVAEVRRKVFTGAYNSLDVVDQVARRILTRGDA